MLAYSYAVELGYNNIAYRYPEVYAVQWDDQFGIVKRGYLPHGLELEG